MMMEFGRNISDQDHRSLAYADTAEKAGNILLKPLRLACGKTVRITEDTSSLTKVCFKPAITQSVGSYSSLSNTDSYWFRNALAQDDPTLYCNRLLGGIYAAHISAPELLVEHGERLLKIVDDEIVRFRQHIANFNRAVNEPPAIQLANHPFKSFLEQSFPVLIASTTMKGKDGRAREEYGMPAKMILGRDIDLLFTDTDEHAEQLREYLKKHRLQDKVTVHTKAVWEGLNIPLTHRQEDVNIIGEDD